MVITEQYHNILKVILKIFLNPGCNITTLVPFAIVCVVLVAVYTYTFIRCLNEDNALMQSSKQNSVFLKKDSCDFGSCVHCTLKYEVY